MGSITQCKICNGPYTSDVNGMLEKKVTQAAVVAWLSTKGITLSTMSVSRHWNNCILGKKKPKKHQKGKVVQMTAASKKTAKKNKDNLKDMKDDPDKVLGKQSKKFHEIEKEEERVKKKLKGVEKILKEMTDDVNVVNEMVWLMAVGKDRVQRSLDEEEFNQMVLATTGRAIADYGKLVKDFNEITTGMDSLSSMRFAQFTSMVLNIFGKTAITDETRKELLELLKETGPDGIEEPISLLPQNVNKRKPQLVELEIEKEN